ncbi:uncharacterized protein LOC119667142 [Teleopsis dalmanni]|uniref:uncharacterized protein LOC119667142 n=1 Tax=Teleopsis dalmanni TaxID=139649 RepID=UPI0018CCCF7B|nr:uncharacterized protein LOC119667142 [Teleopsis dalmanni]
MEHCKEFDDIKAVLTYCNNNVQKYVNLGFRSGNDRIVNEISKRIQDVLLEKHHLSKALEPLPKSYTVLRKVLLFLVLNSDIPRKSECDVFKNLAHVSDLCPLLPKFLLIAIIWELKLDNFLYELISYTPCWFTYPLIEIILESLRYIDDVCEVLEKGEHVIRAMYNSLTNTINYACDQKATVKINSQFYELITRILQRIFSPPDNENIKRKKANARKSGYLVKHIINLISFEET